MQLQNKDTVRQNNQDGFEWASVGATRQKDVFVPRQNWLPRTFADIILTEMYVQEWILIIPAET